jgi:hypothetical protein
MISTGIATMFALGLVSAEPTIKTTSWVTLNTEVEVKAPKAKVWAEMIKGQGLAALTGGEIADKAVVLDKPGATSAGKIWGDPGRFVVTMANKESELRVVFEPDIGHYACQCRFTLTEAGGKTKVTMVDMYSEEKADQKDANAKEAAKKFGEAAQKFAKLFP